jgi:hypothetical protein
MALNELEQESDAGIDASKRVRALGGGRKRLTDHDPTLLADLEDMVEPTSRGDPESPLRWTSKSTRQLAAALQKQGHKVGQQKVADLLADLGYSLQGARKSKEGSTHPDRDAQFKYINAQFTAFQERGQPVVSVDTKKKELVGDFKNGGRAWRPQDVWLRLPERYKNQDPELKDAWLYGQADNRPALGPMLTRETCLESVVRTKG